MVKIYKVGEVVGERGVEVKLVKKGEGREYVEG